MRYLDLVRTARERSETCEIRGMDTQPMGAHGPIATAHQGLNSLNSLLSHLESRCPEHVDQADWQQAVEDCRRFLAQWGERAEALGWTSRNLLGLAPVPDKPAPSYRRLARYDLTGLVWLMRGRPVVALTTDTAAIQSVAGTVTVYRKHNKPSRGPVGDSLDDLE